MAALEFGTTMIVYTLFTCICELVPYVSAFLDMLDSVFIWQSVVTEFFMI